MKRVLCWILVGVLAIAAVYQSAIWDTRSAILLSGAFLVIAVILALRHMIRARNIRQLSSQIRHLLSGAEVMNLSEYKEGELAVLSADIYKVMVAFKEQASVLKKEKNWLAEAISDISHQLKTPITSILMLSELLKKDDLPVERRRQFLEQLSSQSIRLQWLVKSLLTLSKLDAQAIEYCPESIRSIELIEKAAEPLLIAMELRGQSLELRGELDMLLEVDRNWSAEAIGNIIKNASEHGPDNENITITISDRPMNKVIEVMNIGEIPREEIPHLFTRFYRGSGASEESVGIGLAISRVIILQQGGYLEVESEDGKTIFSIRFPK